MAFTEEQEQQLLSLLSNNSKENEEKKDDKSENEEKKDVLGEAKDRYNKELSAKELNESLTNAIKFNLSVNDFIKDNEAILPKEARALYDTVNSKVYSTDVEKANVLRKGLIEQFIELKENFDILPSSLKDKANRFKSLTDDEKAKQSGRYWDIVEIGADRKVLIRKAEQLGKQGGKEQKSDFSDFEKRVLDKVRKQNKD